MSTQNIVKIDENSLLQRCSYFIDVQLWPIRKELDPIVWLDNFTAEERVFARYLLNSFIYLSKELEDSLFLHAFHNISNSLRENARTYEEAKSNWESFKDRVIITHVTGEISNNSDSGYDYVRRARKLWKIDENRLLSGKDAISEYIKEPRPIIFVDDFIGSGQQFIVYWENELEVNNTKISFSELLNTDGNFYYCPLVSTISGMKNIKNKCPNVFISPGYFLNDAYSVFSENTIVWPEEMRAQGIKFVAEVSKRIGIPDKLHYGNYWKGFNSLGLLLSFSDSVPDATIPLIYWEENGWKPLIRKN